MRKLATAAVSFSAAIFVSQYLLPASWALYGAVLSALFSVSAVFIPKTVRLRLLLICLGLAAGFGWNAAYAAIHFFPARALAGTTQEVRAVVCSAPVTTNYGCRVTVRMTRAGSYPVKAQLYINNGTPDVGPGKTIDFTARFKTADSVYGEETDTFFSRGVFLFAYAAGPVKVTGASASALYFPARIAAAAESKILEVFSSDIAGFMKALILGDTAVVGKDTVLSAALSSTGTSHIIAVSGMNIAFLMSVPALFTKNKRALALVGIPVIVLFMGVVGFQPPVVRAGVMQIFILCAPLFKRESDNMTAMSFSLFVILLANPYSAVSAGLQLSFTATVGILLFTEKLYTALDKPLRKLKPYKISLVRKAFRFLIGCFSSTVGALCLSIPLIALHFGTVSLIAPLSNLVVLWSASLTFIGGIGAVLLGFLWLPLGAAAGLIVALPARFFLWAVAALSRLPFAAVYTSNPLVVVWLVYVYALVLVFLLFREARRRPVLPVSLSVASICLILLGASLASGDQRLSVTALDVGQGESIVFSAGRAEAAMDCGSSSGKDAGDILARYVESTGRTSLDMLILSHYHSDHTNGAAEVLSRLRVGALVLPSPAESDMPVYNELTALARTKRTVIIEVAENKTVSFGTASLRILAPVGRSAENDRGLSVVAAQGRFGALVTGDMESDMEQQLVKKDSLPDLTLLVAGHHGSKTSTSEVLLTAVKPEIVFISVGYNSYGQPAAATLKRLSEAGAAVYRTDEDGTVTARAS